MSWWVNEAGEIVEVADPRYDLVPEHQWFDVPDEFMGITLAVRRLRRVFPHALGAGSRAWPQTVVRARHRRRRVP